jgi:ketosteroid isomerase-like protein
VTAARPILLCLLLLLAWLVPACVEVAVDPAPAADKAAPREAPAKPAEPTEPKPAEPNAAAPGPAAQPFEVREPVAPAPASFELLEAGAEPRAAITIRAQAGDRSVVRIGLAMDVAMRVGTSDVPKTTLPRLEVDVAAEVAKVTDATIEVELRVVDVRTDATAVASQRVTSAIEATVAALKTSTGTLVLATDGRVQSISLSSGADAIESKAAGLDHALVELLPAWPREPVGVGARWKLVQPVFRGGVTLQRTSEFHLVAVQDGALELEVHSTHVAVVGGDTSTGGARIEAQSDRSRDLAGACPHRSLIHPTRARIFESGPRDRVVTCGPWIDGAGAMEIRVSRGPNSARKRRAFSR